MKPFRTSLIGTGVMVVLAACNGDLDPDPPGDARLAGSIQGAAHVFGVQPVGSTSSALTWTVSNTGESQSGTPSVAVSGSGAAEFTQSSTCSAPLPPGGSCTVTIAFAPGALGEKSATIEVSASPGGTVKLTLTGSAVFRVAVTTTGTGTVTTSDGKLAACSGTCVADYTEVVDRLTLTADTTNGSDSYFSGWTGVPCEGPIRACELTVNANANVTATFGSYATSGNLVFVSSSVHPTNLGSSAATYDRICNDLASEAGINDAAGTLYMAWISTSSAGDGPALSRLDTSSRGWVRLDGRILADSQASFINASSPAWLNPVAFDERGREITSTPYLLTGTLENGVVHANCNGWSGSGSFVGGSSHGGALSWTNASSYACTTDGRLLCMMTGRTAPLTIPPPPAGAKRIFLTDATYPAAPSTTPDSRCDGELPGAKALVSTTTTPAASLLNPTTVYVRPDGVVVGTGAEIVADELQSGIWQHLNGNYAIGFSSLSYAPWTGARSLDAVGTAETTCSDWTSTAAGSPPVGDSTATYSASMAIRWWYSGTGGCGQSRAFYCFEP